MNSILKFVDKNVHVILGLTSGTSLWLFWSHWMLKCHVDYLESTFRRKCRNNRQEIKYLKTDHEITKNDFRGRFFDMNHKIGDVKKSL